MIKVTNFLCISQIKKDLTVLAQCFIADKQTSTDDEYQLYKPYKNEYIA